MKFMESELIRILREQGASLVGFGDMSGFGTGDMPYGVSIALKLPKEIVRGITHGPTREYFDTYHKWNARLDALARLGAGYLKSCGYQAVGQTSDVVKQDSQYRTKLPHKTVAVQSWLGWIGKCALLITKEYGSAVRLTSILTDAPVTCASPVTASACGSCRACQDACPGTAVKGEVWEPGIARERLYDFARCRDAARKISGENIGEDITLCGKCIEVCPYTQKYIKR